ncbi:D-alanyl-D-alanine carboxypeptidase, partial [Candidatus Electrothrix marina]
MNRCSFLFITLLAPCVFTLSSGHIQTKAENIPVLSYTAKKAPQAETKTNQTPSRLTNSKKIVPQNTSSCTPLILGSHGDISSVKARASRASLTAKNKPRLKELKNISYPTARSAAFNKRITSKSAIIMDAETGRTIFAKAPDNPRQPASTIKVLTGMIAIKRLKNNEKVGVSRHAEKMPRSKVYLSTKKKYKANDLINSVLLASANDASVALAEKIAGSEADFAKLMTL